MQSRNRNNTSLSVLQPVFWTIYPVALSLTNYSDEKLLNILLYESEYFSVKTIQSILKSTIKFLKSYDRFFDPLFLQNEK